MKKDLEAYISGKEPVIRSAINELDNLHTAYMFET